MKRIFLALLFGLVLTGLQAQQKPLTLEDAVLRQYSQFYPASIPGLQWIEGSSTLSWFSDDYTALLGKTIPGGQTDTLLKLDELNKVPGLDLKTIKNPVWLDANRFYFSNNGSYFTYDISLKSGEEWLSIPNGENRHFSPEAEAFAFTIDNNLYVKLKNEEPKAITAFDDPDIVAGQAIARHEFGISGGIFWAPDGSRLAFYQKDESEVSDYPILDITTTPGSLVNVKYPMAGQGSEFASVGVYDLETDQTLYLRVTGPRDQYLTNLGWGPNGRYIFLAELNRAQDHMKLNMYDAFTGYFVKTLFEEKHPKYVEPEQPVHFVPGSDDHFLWFSERDGFNHLYLYSFAGDVINQVTRGNWEAQEIVGFDEEGKYVYVTGTDESGLNTVLYKAGLYRYDLKSLTGEAGMHYYEISGTGEYFIDIFSDSDTPQTIQVTDNTGRIQEILKEAEDPLAGYALGEVDLHTIKAEDGTPLHTRLIKPAHFDPSKQYPVLVYVYGGPHLQLINNRWLSGAPLWMYYFANQGYLVFTLDNRGSANRGFDFENVVHRQLGELEIQDQLAGVDYLKTLPYADTGRMAVHGWSYGGFMTASLMLKTPGVFQVGVAGGPVTDWKYYEVMYGERYMDTPQENPEGYEKTSLLNKADKLEGDLLLIHGTSDDVVVMQHNLSLVKAFIEAGKQVDFFPYPMHQHNVRGKDRLHLMEKVLGYVGEKLEE
jgi:dipeptidyl-peptidase-4